MTIRLAVPGDALALLEIYRQYIQTPITFEYELPTLEEFTRRISDALKQYPYLVLEDQGRLLGYTYAHPEREWKAYQWNAELSIYLSSRAAGRGLGTALYLTLMDLLRLQGVKTVCGIVTRPNPASEGLHRALGFRLTGVREKAGYKNGTWHDVMWLEKPLGTYGPQPSPVLPVGQLPRDAVERVLSAHLA